LYEFLFLPYTVKDRIGYEFYCHTESEEWVLLPHRRVISA
jgi:hypothetical protein